MPKSLRVELTDGQRRDLHALLARRDLTAYTPQRAGCIRFLDRGRSVPETADLLERNPVTVRAAVHRLRGGGIWALPDAPRPGRPARLLGPDDRAALAELLDDSAAKGITWSVPTLCEWLRVGHGACVGSGQGRLSATCCAASSDACAYSTRIRVASSSSPAVSGGISMANAFSPSTS
ncbi:transposase [Streptomyces sp. NPDC101455]|uniref:helix-turn-helix domain-containing protein n=1 Tax=Streptomyces sp. NPDC101455 TaxID=3366142 RepID=UPI00381FEC1A